MYEIYLDQQRIKDAIEKEKNKAISKLFNIYAIEQISIIRENIENFAHNLHQEIEKKTTIQDSTICKDCNNVCKRDSLSRELPEPEWICLAQHQTNYLTGEKTHENCYNVNNGFCRYYKENK